MKCKLLISLISYNTSEKTLVSASMQETKTSRGLDKDETLNSFQKGITKHACFKGAVYSQKRNLLNKYKQSGKTRRYLNIKKALEFIYQWCYKGQR